MLKNANNPQAMISQLMENNPKMQQIRELIEANGGDAEKAFRNTAKQMGIDPDEFINNLK